MAATLKQIEKQIKKSEKAVDKQIRRLAEEMQLLADLETMQLRLTGDPNPDDVDVDYMSEWAERKLNKILTEIV